MWGDGGREWTLVASPVSAQASSGLSLQSSLRLEGRT